ncbi:Metallo-hydrolase/oxidoreductase [Delitschia confertaspora ATCC 74209]|uniref:Metallo-hydrolase/oxidoreductase n=1 Tax=Delitschia confertaspora ATCC 74209 TaxID=1513339 RepID=A0A9P4JMR3_9PLEO|nr:Metallo-hydrolase/oxidoreductase [Delitschia confertaspora ATCC 74209]
MTVADIRCTPLPEPEDYVHLSLLDGGSFIGDLVRVHAGIGSVKYRMYNWAFYISHKGRHILWDLGLTEDRTCYTPWVNEFMLASINHVGPRRALTEQLRERGTESSQIDSVLFSHAHWDHCRPIRREFPNATAYFGPGTHESCSPGHFLDSSLQWDGRYFDPHNATEKWKELEGPWTPFGPFDKAMDFFGDGTFWVIQAPGHMPGNLCAAARIRGNEWVLLGSDCCHSRELLDGKYEIAEFCVPGLGKSTLHADLQAAQRTIERVRVLEKEFGFHVALAHDASWMKSGADQVLMSLLDESMKQAAREKIPLDEIP